MKWNFEIVNNVKKTKYIIYVLAGAVLSRLLSLTSLYVIAYGLYYSVAAYWIIVWGSANKTVINLMNAVHNKIVIC